MRAQSVLLSGCKYALTTLGVSCLETDKSMRRIRCFLALPNGTITWDLSTWIAVSWIGGCKQSSKFANAQSVPGDSRKRLYTFASKPHTVRIPNPSWHCLQATKCLSCALLTALMIDRWSCASLESAMSARFVETCIISFTSLSAHTLLHEEQPSLDTCAMPECMNRLNIVCTRNTLYSIDITDRRWPCAFQSRC